MKNLKIGKKLIVAFGSIIIGVVIMAFFAFGGLSIVGSNFDKFYNEPFQVSNQVMEMRRAIQSTAKNINYAFATADEAKTKEYITSAISDIESLSSGISYLREHFTQDLQLVEKFSTTLSRGSDARERIAELALVNNNTEAGEIFFGEYQPVLLESNAYLTQIYDLCMETAESTFARADSMKNLTLGFVVGVSVLALAITVAFFLYLVKGLTRPIIQIEQAADQMARGEFNVELTYESKDELGALSNSMRNMTQITKGVISDTARGLKEVAKGNFNIAPKVEYVGVFEEIEDAIKAIIGQLSGTMKQIGQAADQVATGADQIANGAQALASGATEQASSIEELASTINLISDQIGKNADNATVAKGKAALAGEEILQSNEKMEDMIAAMKQISEKSGQIGKIIKTIEDIAFQTNILALNAAVEAARAGEAGKGFAVVAGEVRSLASKSADAANDTTSLIEETIKAVDNGTKIADDTAKSMLTVVDRAKDVTYLVEEIAEASMKQAESVKQVTQGVDQISAVVQTNSATAEESAAASEELSGQSQMLKSLLQQFRLLDLENAAALGYHTTGSRSMPEIDLGEPAPVSLGMLDSKY